MRVTACANSGETWSYLSFPQRGGSTAEPQVHACVGYLRVIAGCELGPGPKVRLAICRSGCAGRGGRIATSCCSRARCCGLCAAFHVDCYACIGIAEFELLNSFPVYQQSKIRYLHKQLSDAQGGKLSEDLCRPEIISWEWVQNWRLSSEELGP
jgi:hypothetical protein